MIRYSEDTNHFVYLDPTHTQAMNIYFMGSTLQLKDNIWDIFDFSEYEMNIAEHSHTSNNIKWMSPNKTLSERKYVKVYLR